MIHLLQDAVPSTTGVPLLVYKRLEYLYSIPLTILGDVVSPPKLVAIHE